MIDPSIIAALQYPFPPAMPPMFEERTWKSPAAERFERIGRQKIDSFSSYVDSWQANLETVRLRFPYEALMRLGEQGLIELDETIAEVESLAEEKAKELGRIQKRARKLVKIAFQRDPSMGAAARTLTSALIKIEERVVEELLDFALWIRATKSMADPSARGGQTFIDTESLEKYLERETA